MCCSVDVFRFEVDSGTRAMCRSIWYYFFFSSRRRHTRWNCDWSSDVCSSDLPHLHWHFARLRRRLYRRASDATHASGCSSTFSCPMGTVHVCARGTRVCRHDVLFVQCHLDQTGHLDRDRVLDLRVLRLQAQPPPQMTRALATTP